MASCGSCFWCIIWLVILLFLGWPLGITLGGLYGLISPLTTCLGLDRLSDLLLEGANLGRTCAQNMRHGKPLCWDLPIVSRTGQHWDRTQDCCFSTEKKPSLLRKKKLSMSVLCEDILRWLALNTVWNFSASYVTKRSARSGKWIPLVLLTCN